MNLGFAWQYYQLLYGVHECFVLLHLFENTVRTTCKYEHGLDYNTTVCARVFHDQHAKISRKIDNHISGGQLYRMVKLGLS